MVAAQTPSSSIVPAGSNDTAIVLAFDDGETYFREVRIVAWDITRAAGNYDAEPILAGDGPATYEIVGIVRPDGGVDVPFERSYDSVEEFKAQASEFARLKAVRRLMRSRTAESEAA